MIFCKSIDSKRKLRASFSSKLLHRTELMGIYKQLPSKGDLPSLKPLRFRDLCRLNLDNDVNYYSFDTGIVYLLSISSDGTVSEVCGPVHLCIMEV